VIIELYDNQNKFIASLDSHTKEISFSIHDYSSMMDRASAEWTPYCLQWDFNKLATDQRSRVRFAKFIEVGQDVEYWAGHYGTRFCKEEIVIKSNDPCKDLTKYLKNRRLMELPIHSYFNEGQGLCFWADGVRQSNELYNNLNDFDYSFAYRTKKVMVL